MTKNEIAICQYAQHSSANSSCICISFCAKRKKKHEFMRNLKIFVLYYPMSCFAFLPVGNNKSEYFGQIQDL